MQLDRFDIALGNDGVLQLHAEVGPFRIRGGLLYRGLRDLDFGVCAI